MQNTKDELLERIDKAIDRYLRSRAEILKLGKEAPELIGGNDNVIGRIGEYVALRFLRSLGQNPQKVLAVSNPGYDLIDGETKTQVKVITKENKRGRSVRLGTDWDQFILIEFDEEYRPNRLGVLKKTEHLKAQQHDSRLSGTPVVSISMLNPKGLIGKYGTVHKPDDASE